MSTQPAGPEIPTSYPPLPPPSASSYRQPPKSPALAVVLSFFFPGIGQVYNGQISRGVFFFALFAASIAACVHIDPMPFALFIPFIYLFGLVDAYNGARAINGRFLNGPGTDLDQETPESPAWGGSLIVLGAVLLLNNFGWISLAALHRWWPVLLIVAGFVLLRGALGRPPEGGASTSTGTGDGDRG